MTVTRIAFTGAVAIALVVTSTLPAHAATVEWVGPPTGSNQETSVAANWSGNTLPEPGDVWRFAAGTRANNSLPLDTAVGGLVLDSADFLLIGTRIELGGGGVAASDDAELNLDITLTGSQTWMVAEGSRLIVRGTVLVPSGELTLAPTGTIDVTTGRIDGFGGAGSVRQTSGTVVLSGSGGTIGDGGYRILAGTTHWQGSMGGTAVQLSGEDAVLSGVGAAQRITAVPGTVSPGPLPGGGGVGELESWDTITLTPATRLQLDVTGSGADSLLAYQSIDLGGALLELRVPEGIDPLERTTIAHSTLGVVSGGLATADGPIALGEPFASGGHRWMLSVSEAGSTLELLWIERIIVDDEDAGGNDDDNDGGGTTLPPNTDDDGGGTTLPPNTDDDGGVLPPAAPTSPELAETGVSLDVGLLMLFGGGLMTLGLFMVTRRLAPVGHPLRR